MAKDMVLHPVCFMCNKDFTVEVNHEDFKRWQEGELAQNAFPYLDEWDRELLISKTCKGCFESLFGPGDR